MYSRLNLGRFNVPEGENWPVAVSYTPEPPVQVRGGLNPWQLERTRVLYVAEEAAWKKIQEYQARYRTVDAHLKSSIASFNSKLREFESVTGKKSGIQQISTYGGMVAVIPGFQLLGGLFAAIGFLSSLIGGNKKKKKAERLARELQQLQASMIADQQQLQSLADAIGQQTTVTAQVQQAQQQIVTAAVQQSEQAYQAKQANEAQISAAIEARNLYAARLYPARQGGNNAL